MKKQITAMLLSALLLTNATACNIKPDAPEQETERTLEEITTRNSTIEKFSSPEIQPIRSISVEELLFTSNGDGTCSLTGLIPSRFETSFWSVEIPSRSSAGELVTCIKTEVFRSQKNLVQVTIPDSVSTIEPFAFSFCTNLVQITLPNNLLKIDTNLFNHCENLKEITIPESVSSIEECAFSNCSSLSKIVISSNVSYIGHSAFNECNSLIEITLPNSAVTLGRYVFSNCTNLTSVALSNTLQSIDFGTFVGCYNLASVAVGGEYYHIDKNCLIETKAKKLIAAWGVFSIPANESVTKIGSGAFGACSGLTELTLPRNIEVIEARSFWGCKSIKHLILSQNNMEIGEEVVTGCKNLTDITIPGNITKIDPIAFKGVEGIKIHYNGTCSQWQTLTADLKDQNYIAVYCIDGAIISSSSAKNHH